MTEISHDSFCDAIIYVDTILPCWELGKCVDVIDFIPYMNVVLKKKCKSPKTKKIYMLTTKISYIYMHGYV